MMKSGGSQVRWFATKQNLAGPERPRAQTCLIRGPAPTDHHNRRVSSNESNGAITKSSGDDELQLPQEFTADNDKMHAWSVDRQADQIYSSYSLTIRR